MPWCAACDKFLSPPSVTADGRCPTCGRAVDPGKARLSTREERPEEAASGDEELPPIPRHLKVLGVAMVIYLGYRFAQGVEWVVHRF